MRTNGGRQLLDLVTCDPCLLAEVTISITGKYTTNDTHYVLV
jgi:hypothetical protein